MRGQNKKSANIAEDSTAKKIHKLNHQAKHTSAIGHARTVDEIANAYNLFRANSQ